MVFTGAPLQPLPLKKPDFFISTTQTVQRLREREQKLQPAKFWKALPTNLLLALQPAIPGPACTNRAPLEMGALAQPLVPSPSLGHSRTPQLLPHMPSVRPEPSCPQSAKHQIQAQAVPSDQKLFLHLQMVMTLPCWIALIHYSVNCLRFVQFCS